MDNTFILNDSYSSDYLKYSTHLFPNQNDNYLNIQQTIIKNINNNNNNNNTFTTKIDTISSACRTTNYNYNNTNNTNNSNNNNKSISISSNDNIIKNNNNESIYRKNINNKDTIIHCQNDNCSENDDNVNTTSTTNNNSKNINDNKYYNKNNINNNNINNNNNNKNDNNNNNNNNNNNDNNNGYNRNNDNNNDNNNNNNNNNNNDYCNNYCNIEENIMSKDIHIYNNDSNTITNCLIKKDIEIGLNNSVALNDNLKDLTHNKIFKFSSYIFSLCSVCRCSNCFSSNNDLIRDPPISNPPMKGNELTSFATSDHFLLTPSMLGDKAKKCVIIDLDETLVHSSFKPVQKADFIVPVDIDGKIHQVYVQKRPFVDEFLSYMSKNFECVLFTASLSKYADPVSSLLDRHNCFKYKLYRDSCVFYRGNYVKDLSRLGRELKSTIIIDNSPMSYLFHPDNAVPVKSWFDDPEDTELWDLIPFFEGLNKVEDVRRVLGHNL